MFSFVNQLTRLLARTFSDHLKSRFTIVTQFIAKQISEVCLTCNHDYWTMR
jgi:hypothetical protein